MDKRNTRNYSHIKKEGEHFTKKERQECMREREGRKGEKIKGREEKDG